MDDNLMMLNLSQVIRQGTDGIVLMSPKPSSGWIIMSSALSSNIPIISLDEMITDSSGRQLVPYIGIDHDLAGRLAGGWAAGQMREALWFDTEPGACKVAVLLYDDLAGMRRRTRSFTAELLESTPELARDDCIMVDCSGGSAVSGLLAMQQLISEYPGVHRWFVFGATAQSVIGAVKALEQVDLAASALACGIDGGAGFLEFDRGAESPYQAMIHVDTYEQGYRAAQTLFDYARHQAIIPAAEYLPTELITREQWKVRGGLR
jgi:L-arabinose transport system substrate-binding protein